MGSGEVETRSATITCPGCRTSREYRPEHTDFTSIKFTDRAYSWVAFQCTACGQFRAVGISARLHEALLARGWAPRALLAPVRWLPVQTRPVLDEDYLFTMMRDLAKLEPPR